MEKYTGTKTIKAKPMTRGGYNKYRGWDIPEDENPLDPGYLVGYSNVDGIFNGKLEGDSDYISWSPKANFEASYVNHKDIKSCKTLHNSTVSGAHKNISDLEVVGNGDMFRLICKASSKNEGWMKSTKAMELPNGCLVQVTTQQGNNVAEALAFVPGVKIAEDSNNVRKLV